MSVTSVPRTNKVDLAILLQRTMAEKKVTQRQIAERSTLAPMTVDQIVNGYNTGGSSDRISIWTLVGLADALDLQVDTVIEAISPGSALAVKNSDVAAARLTIDNRKGRRAKPTATVVNVVNVPTPPATKPVGAMPDAVANLLEAGRVIGLDPKEMLIAALAEVVGSNA